MKHSLACLLLLLGGGNALASGSHVAQVPPTLQTPILTKADMKADADDPAIYVPANAPDSTLIVTAVKNGGIRVYSLKGDLVQALGPQSKGSRINNVDVVYDFPLDDGSRADLVVGSDRGLDVIRVWKIDATSQSPLTEITAPEEQRAFATRQLPDGSGEEDNPVKDQNTVYGLAAWHDLATGKVWVAGTQRHQPVVGLFLLEARPGGKVAAIKDHSFKVPVTHKGQSLLEESETDPLKDWSPQFEGSVIDRTTGMLYAGQEDVGIWRIKVSDPQAEPVLLYETRGAATSSFHNPQSVIARDVEGLTLYYSNDGTRYLLASSQGSAHGDQVSADAPYDDSFVVFDVSDTLTPLGSFHVAASGDIDAVQESDGADVISLALPGFPNGLFITQDGYAGDLNNLNGEVSSTNFKFVDWKQIAESFSPPLKITPKGVDPRQ